MQLRLLKNIVNGTGLYRQSHRNFHVTNVLRHDPNNVTEVRIPVPWGHIAGKWWGDTNQQPILALHGWQDNAGSFDLLLELFPDSLPVLAIDFPGHGFSSHYPEGMFYHSTDFIMVIRRVQKYFKWDKKINMIGHSAGGVLAFLFSALYPEFVNVLITIDVVKPLPPRNSTMLKLGELIDTSITKSKRVSSKSSKYSLDDIQKRWLDGTKGSLTPDAVKILMKRGVQLDQESGQYSYIRDPKVKIHPLQRFDENLQLELARNLKCHYIALRCSNGWLFDYSLKNSPTFISTVSEAAKSFKIVTVESNHHGHLTNPERFAPIIIDCLQTVNS